MKKLASNFLNMALVLSGITIFAAITLTSVHSMTNGPIINSQRYKQIQAIQAVLPPFDHVDTNAIKMDDGVETMKMYKAYDNKNAFVGAAVEASSNNGYKSHIDIMVGFNKEGVIVNYAVLEQNETPGLGSKMFDWFKTNNKNQNILGKNPASSNLTVTKDGGDVDGITAATISSRAFLFAVRNAYFAFVSNLEKPKVESQVENDTIQQATTDLVSNLDVKGRKQ